MRTICTDGTEDINALFRITIVDSEGHESNVVEYRTTCGTLDVDSDDTDDDDEDDNDDA